VRFGPHQLRTKALQAIDEAAQACRSVPLDRSRALAFALAYLWAFSDAERWPFDNFWQAVASSNQTGRSQSVNAARNAIYRALGMEPTPLEECRGEQQEAQVRG
jgi:hypothetical protein